MRDYTKILAWQRADDLTVAVYEATRGFPKEEVYSLTSQLRRSAYSVPSNIVEGSSRESLKDYLHFLHIARGSLSETRYFIHLAGRLGYLADDRRQSLMEASEDALRVLAGLIRSVEKEAGVVSRTLARATSFLVLSFGSLLFSWSKV